MKKILSVKEVATYLKASTSWVYAYAPELGGAKIGGTWFFTEEGVDDALSKWQEMASTYHASGAEAYKTVRDEKGSSAVGKRKTKKTQNLRKLAAEHGLADLVH